VHTSGCRHFSLASEDYPWKIPPGHDHCCSQSAVRIHDQRRDTYAIPSPAEIDLPFTANQGFILIQGSVDASRGVFMLDTGTPFDFFINRDLVPLPSGEAGASGSASSGQQIVMLKHGGNHLVRLAAAYV